MTAAPSDRSSDANPRSGSARELEVHAADDGLDTGGAKIAERARNYGAAAVRQSDEIADAEAVIVVFHADADVLQHHVFQAAAGGPAIDPLRHVQVEAARQGVERVNAQGGRSPAALAVDEDPIPRITELSGHAVDIGKSRRSRASGEQNATARRRERQAGRSGLADVEVVEHAFDPDNKVAGRLPAEAKLRAAEPAIRRLADVIDRRQARHRAVGDGGVRTPGRVSPDTAGVAADIETGPAEHRRRRWCRRF